MDVVVVVVVSAGAAGVGDWSASGAQSVAGCRRGSKKRPGLGLPLASTFSSHPIRDLFVLEAKYICCMD
jgi:hypothetical protein